MYSPYSLVFSVSKKAIFCILVLVDPQKTRRAQRAHACAPQAPQAARSAAAGGGQQLREIKRHFRFRGFATNSLPELHLRSWRSSPQTVPRLAAVTATRPRLVCVWPSLSGVKSPTRSSVTVSPNLRRARRSNLDSAFGGMQLFATWAKGGRRDRARGRPRTTRSTPPPRRGSRP